MRWKIVEVFNELANPFLNSIQSIAVVGGGISEPELEIFRTKPDIDFHFFGVDSNVGSSNFTYLDLNTRVSESYQIVDMKFDLVLCSQVLEHTWDVKQAIYNLVQLLKPNGLIWVGCPASNYAHGSPSYFSAGYQPELIANLMEVEGVEIIAKDSFGSRRYYFMTHALQIWGSRKEHLSPITFGFSRFFPSQFLGRFYATFKSPKIYSGPKYATETFVFGRKSI